ncbi:MAG: hypothetical protein NTV34_02310, partial [Proteobacteria bacterium]|nr:hypothetical protein [Pseudomonadota bacterium]
LAVFLGRFSPDIAGKQYPKEIWKLYQNGKLTKDSKLTGQFAQSTKKADVAGVLEEIEAARDDDLIRRGIKVDPSNRYRK